MLDDACPFAAPLIASENNAYITYYYSVSLKFIFSAIRQATSGVGAIFHTFLSPSPANPYTPHKRPSVDLYLLLYMDIVRLYIQLYNNREPHYLESIASSAAFLMPRYTRTFTQVPDSMRWIIIRR